MLGDRHMAELAFRHPLRDLGNFGGIGAGHDLAGHGPGDWGTEHGRALLVECSDDVALRDNPSDLAADVGNDERADVPLRQELDRVRERCGLLDSKHVVSLTRKNMFHFHGAYFLNDCPTIIDLHQNCRADVLS